MTRHFTKYPSNYVKASRIPKNNLSNSEFTRLKNQIRQGQPITQSEYDELNVLFSDYNNAIDREMRKPVQKCDMSYAMYMRECALEVKDLLENAIVE